MLQALYEADSSRFMFAFSLPDFIASMRKLGWNDKAEIDRFIREDEASLREQAGKWRPCVARERNPFEAQKPSLKG